MNIRLKISYLGTKYHGFQVQSNALAVCTVLQDAIEKIYGVRHALIGCSRTDTGVHAKGYIANFHTEKYIKPWQIAVALNRFLPGDVRVLEAQEVEESFHSRYSVHSKKYVYRINNSRVQSPFNSRYVAHYPEKLDVELMSRAAADFIGKKDFRSFCGKSPEGIPDDTVRHIAMSKIEMDGDIITYSVVADGFLYKMVRIIIGTLIEIGAGRMEPDCIPKLLAQKDRTHRGATAKSKGLTLEEVYY